MLKLCSWQQGSDNFKTINKMIKAKFNRKKLFIYEQK